MQKRTPGLSMTKWILIFCIGIFAMLSFVHINNVSAATSYTSENDFAFDTTTGHITDYKGSDTKVIIPETIHGITVTGIEWGTFMGDSKVTEIILPQTIRTIGSMAFEGCSGLSSIKIPSGVSVIAPYTFYGCTGLNTVTLPSSVNKIQLEAFGGCTSLKTIVLPSSVNTIETDAFRGCNSQLTIVCEKGSYGETYAKQAGISFKEIVTDDSDDNTEDDSTEPGVNNDNNNGSDSSEPIINDDDNNNGSDSSEPIINDDDNNNGSDSSEPIINDDENNNGNDSSEPIINDDNNNNGSDSSEPIINDDDNNNDGNNSTEPTGNTPTSPDASQGTESGGTSTVPETKNVLSLGETSATLYIQGKKTITLQAFFNGSLLNGTTVTWNSSNPKVASVNGNGKVSAKKKGTVTISATYNGITVESKITVKKPTLKLKTSKATLKVSKKIKISAKATPAKKITYKSLNKKIATVTKKGVVIAKHPGKTQIIVKANGVKKSFTITVKE